jgi:DNA-binding response OmpR family regulator
LILAHSERPVAARIARAFWELGWVVLRAESGARAAELVGLRAPSVVLLDTDLPQESGWLTCNKLTCRFPDLRVLLLAHGPDAADGRFAEFVGAGGVIDEDRGLEHLVDEVLRVVPLAVG